MIFVFFFTDSTFAAITTDKLTSTCKLVDGKTAVIGTSTTVCHGSSVFQFIDLVDREHSSFPALFITFSGDQCCTKRTHDTGNIRTDGFTVGNLFKAAENCVIIESTTLYYDMFAKFCSIRNFDNFVKCVFDNRICKTCRNI